MSAIRICAAVATLAFAVNTAFAHGPSGHAHPPPKGGYYIGDVPRKCTADGDRCAGAEHKPYVKYAPCCDEHKVCAEDEHLGWGLFCIEPPKKYHDDKCYKTGMRCMGEKNKPYVEYKPCCNEKDECVKADDDWGSFCVTVKDDKKYDSEYKKEKEYPDKKEYPEKKEYPDEKKDYSDYKKDDYKEDYGEKYDSYYKKDDYKAYGDYGDYGYGGYGKDGKALHDIGGKGKVKDFEKKFDLFPKIPVGKGGPVVTLPPTSRNVNRALIALLGLPATFGCAAIPPAAAAATDVIPVNTNPDRGDVFIEGPFEVCNIPGRGLSNPGARAVLAAICTRLQRIDPTVECYIEQIRGAPVSRMGVSEMDNKVAERQVTVVTVRTVTVRCIFRGGRLFLQVFVQVLVIIFIQFPGVSVGVVPTVSPLG